MPPPPPPEKDYPPSSNNNALPQEPEKAQVPTTPKYNSQDKDLEAQRPPGTAQSALGPSYGFNPQDQPTQPPRRVASSRSLSRVRSVGSLRSSVFGNKTAGTHTDAGAPPPIPAQFSSQPHHARDEEEGDDEPSDPEEVPWGPSHPCFPHPNPHVPLNSPEYIATRIIRIRRDWMVVGDLAPTFSNIYPEILDPLLSESEFRFLLQHINTTLVEAFDPFSTSNWIDGLLGLATGWLWEDFRPGGIKGKLRELERWIGEWNNTVGARDGVKIISLRRTAYMNLDIQIPDPQVRVIGEGEDEDEDEYDNNGQTAATEREESVLRISRGASRVGTERSANR